MTWQPPRPEPKPLPERIATAAAELKLARRDGSANWIRRASKTLDDLIDELPRTKQGSAT